MTLTRIPGYTRTMNPCRLIPLIMLLLALSSGSARAGEHCGHNEPEHANSHTRSASFGETAHDHEGVNLCAPEDSPCHHHCCDMHHDAPATASNSGTQTQRPDQQASDPMPWRSLTLASPRGPPAIHAGDPQDARSDDPLRHHKTIVLLN